MTSSNIIGPESIVTSLEYSKKLKEAGFYPQSCLYVWIEYPHGDSHCVTFEESQNRNGSWEWYPAPTAEEILRRLPEQFQSVTAGTVNGKWRILPLDAMINIGTKIPGDIRVDAFEQDTIANAAAAMWIYLKENNLLPSDK